MTQSFSIPELRGMPRPERSPVDKPYSVASYAAQYGITLELADEMVYRFSTHGEIVSEIKKQLLESEQLMDRALMRGEHSLFPAENGDDEAARKVLEGGPEARRYLGEL